MLITFSGLDGSGKTTQINLFTGYLKENNYRFKKLTMYDDISSSAFIRKWLCKNSKQNITLQQSKSNYRNDKNRKDAKIVFLRKIAYFIDTVIFSWKSFFLKRWGKNIVIMDRYFYDSLANLYHAPSKIYLKAMLNLIPKADISLFLDVKPEIAFSRKPEYSPESYFGRQDAYRQIFKDVTNGYIITSNGIDSTHKEITQLFQRIKAGKRKYTDKFSTSIDNAVSVVFGQNQAVNEGIDFNYFIETLNKNRITVRTLDKIYPFLKPEDKKRALSLLNEEKHRLKKSLEIIDKVTKEFEKRKEEFLVIKTLDNLPDLGHDIDIYTEADVPEIDDIFINTFKANLESQTISERMNQKRNYKIPDYATFEVHCGRLGQLGEERKLPHVLLKTRIKVNLNGIITYAPLPELRMLLVVQQRMYRHFNIRLCDIYNTINLIYSNRIDWTYLKKISREYGMWQGTLLYLSYLQKLAFFYGIDMNIGRYLENKNWPKELMDKNMHFHFPLLSTGLNIYSRKILKELLRLNFYSIWRIFLIIPLSIVHFTLVKIYGRSRIW